MKSIAYSLALTAFALSAFAVMLATKTAQQQIHLFNSATDYPDHLLAHSYAVLVSTNLVPQNCSCGFCDPSRNIAVPEHINSIGHDLRYEISTNFLPIVSFPAYKGERGKEGGL